MSKNSSKKLTPKADLGRPWRVIAATVAALLASQLIATFFVLVGLSLLHPGVSPSGLLDGSSASQFALILLAESMVVWWVFSRLKARQLSLGFIGLGRRPAWSDLVRALLGFAAFFVALTLVSVIVGWLWPDINNKQQIGFDHLQTFSDSVLAFLALVILPPLGEEPLIRGYLYSGLRARWRFVPAMLVTSLVFGLLHLEIGSGSPLAWAAALNTLLLSFVLVYLREKTGALYAGMAVHMLNNLVAFGVHFR